MTPAPRTGGWLGCTAGSPPPGLVIFGHSHIPLDAADDRLRILNPGSPTDKRRQPHRTLAELTITDSRLESARIVELP